MSKHYRLEVFAPGEAEDAFQTMESDHPFMAMQIGDLLNPQGWSDYDNRHADKVYRIAGLEHVFRHVSMGGNWKHTILVFTTEEPDRREARPGHVS